MALRMRSYRSIGADEARRLGEGLRNAIWGDPHEQDVDTVKKKIDELIQLGHTKPAAVPGPGDTGMSLDVPRDARDALPAPSRALLGGTDLASQLKMDTTLEQEPRPAAIPPELQMIRQTLDLYGPRSRISNQDLAKVTQRAHELSQQWKEKELQYEGETARSRAETARVSAQNRAAVAERVLALKEKGQQIERDRIASTEKIAGLNRAQKVKELEQRISSHKDTIEMMKLRLKYAETEAERDEILRIAEITQRALKADQDQLNFEASQQNISTRAEMGVGADVMSDLGPGKVPVDWRGRPKPEAEWTPVEREQARARGRVAGKPPVIPQNLEVGTKTREALGKLPVRMPSLRAYDGSMDLPKNYTAEQRRLRIQWLKANR